MDKSINFLSSDIIEYDMREAGFSVIQQNHLLPEKEIKRLKKFPKEQRTIEIGKLERKDKALKQGKAKAFQYYRELFGSTNELTNEDILSVKKDAIFVKKYCYKTTFGDFVEFREKNVYKAYMHFGSFEFYLTYDGRIDVKGLSDNNVPKHEKGMLQCIRQIMELFCQYDTKRAIKYIVKIIDMYKFYELPVDYYREFNSLSGYRLLQNDEEVVVYNVGESYKNQLIIDYNFMNVLVPILNLVLS